MTSKRHMPTRLMATVGFVAAALSWGPEAAAGVISYRVFNHPDGSAIGSSVDNDGYALRLDVSGVHTFNANHSFLKFSWTPGGTTAKLKGTVTHNESGPTSNFDATDDVWLLDATFSMVSFSDPELVPFFPSGSTTTFDDMLAALLADANAPNTSAEKSIDVTPNAARIYFELIDLTMTTSVLSPAYTGPTVWDEFPNDVSKQFFIQYRWRLWDSEFNGSDFDVLGAAGWLESPPGSGLPGGCCQDFLFTLGKTPVPEPGSLLFLAVLGLGAVRASSTRIKTRR